MRFQDTINRLRQSPAFAGTAPPPPASLSPMLAARREHMQDLAIRQGKVPPPGRDLLLSGGHQGPGGVWMPPASAVASSQKYQATNGLMRIQLENPDGMHLGGRFFEPGRSVMVDYDPAAGVMLHRGEPLLLGLTPSDVHDPTELSTWLFGYTNEEFRHGDVSQVIPVDNDEDKYAVFSSNAAFRPAKVKTTDDAAIAELKVVRSLTNYKVVIRRIGAFIPDPTARQVTNRGYDIRYVHMGRCSRVIDMDLELDVLGPSGLLTTSSAWNANNVQTLPSGSQWGGSSGRGANSDPILDLRTMIETSAKRITRFVMNQRVAGYFLDHPKVRDYMRSNGGDAPLDSSIKAVADMGEDKLDFKIRGIGTISVVASRIESNVAGTATDYIMPDVVVGVAQPPGMPTNGESIATAYTFRRKGPAGVGFYTREVRVDTRGAGGTMIIVEEASIPTMVGPIVGGLIEDVSQ